MKQEYFGGLRGELAEVAEVADGGKVKMAHSVKSGLGEWIVAFTFKLEDVIWRCQANSGEGELYSFRPEPQGISNLRAFKEHIGGNNG